MKAKTILGVFIALTLVITLSLPAIAGKPIPEVNATSVLYTHNYTGSNLELVRVFNITWQHTHPSFINVYLYSALDLKGIAVNVAAPKGKAGKYPQNASAMFGVSSGTFTDGANVTVQVRLLNKKYNIKVDSGVVTNITWGTSSSWTAP